MTNEPQQPPSSQARNPWDRPPFPKHGDEKADETYAAVGQLLSQWETMEAELSHIYAIAIGKYPQSEAYEDYYDKGRTSKARVERVRCAVQRFSIKYPDQNFEGGISNAMEAVLGFADRRHEVAHGIVRPIQWYGSAITDLATAGSAPFQFCLVPPHYHCNWFDDDQMPKYVYTSIELKMLTALMWQLTMKVITLKGFFVSRQPV